MVSVAWIFSPTDSAFQSDILGAVLALGYFFVNSKAFTPSPMAFLIGLFFAYLTISGTSECGFKFLSDLFWVPNVSAVPQFLFVVVFGSPIYFRTSVRHLT